MRRAWQWWSRGQLVALYPHGIPAALVPAIEAFESGIKQHEAHLLDEARERREATP